MGSLSNPDRAISFLVIWNIQIYFLLITEIYIMQNTMEREKKNGGKLHKKQGERP